MSPGEVTILIVEDNEIDRELVKRAFRKARIGNPIVFAENGEEALELLQGKGEAEPAVQSPYVVLTDLNMPRMNGHELLDAMRGDPNLARAIVFVLTTSDADKDRWAAYDRNVAGYILKEKVGEDFMRLIGMLDHFWKVVEFPADQRGADQDSRSA